MSKSLVMDTPQSSNDLQTEFDMFYDTACQLLSQFYSERTITVISRDPENITPAIKASLRRKTRLMHAGRVEEASQRTGSAYRQRHSHQLQVAAQQIEWQGRLQGHVGGGKAVTGRRQEAGKVDDVTGTSFNDYYASISTDVGYQCPSLKHTATKPNNEFVLEWTVFKMLDSLCTTATGLDLLPSWFLKLAAPVLCKPIARLSTCHFRRQPCRLSGRLHAYIRYVPN